MPQDPVLPAQFGTVADVAVETSFGSNAGGLSYAVPAELAGQLKRGQLVWVPLRKQTVRGIVLNPDSGADRPSLRAVTAVVDPSIVLTESQLRIAAWLSRETATSFFN